MEADSFNDPHRLPFTYHCQHMGPGLNTTRENCLHRQNDELGCMYVKCKQGSALWADDNAPADFTQPRNGFEIPKKYQKRIAKLLREG